MPRESIAREKLKLSVLVRRLGRLFFIACVGGAIVGAVLGIASAVHIWIFWSPGFETFGQLIQGVALSTAYSAAFFGVLGAITSPLPMWALYRVRFNHSAFLIYKTCDLLALTALIFPLVGVLAVGCAFVVMCAYRARAGPIVWPPVVAPGHCIGCGYDLHGIDADNCPECARHRNRPLECRVCSQPTAWPWAANPSRPPICSGCGQDLTPVPACQRCGNPLSPGTVNCPGCHRPTGLPSKT